MLPPGWFTFEHLHYYQPAMLDALLRNTGFEVSKSASTCTAITIR